MPARATRLEELADGATIAVPNDGTNEARALLLLEAQGLIKLNEGAGFTATKLDIAENPKNLDIRGDGSRAAAPCRCLDVDFGGHQRQLRHPGRPEGQPTRWPAEAEDSESLPRPTPTCWWSRKATKTTAAIHGPGRRAEDRRQFGKFIEDTYAKALSFAMF